ncbi:morphogenesis-like protein [Psychrobacter sp. AntiMn-1]|uniref:lysozyme n=1 Tax=Psychrobacter sp. AntiMn-1 TaxID=1720344 RepID=UPI0008A66AD0|nr:lysozyme [Psychrobacter sp. AntiMn-1]AOY43450.1 morphogenesis-like protein [Psychrobacter sp. AntiMn-1]
MTETRLTEKAFFDWMRSQQDDGRLSQTEVNGANELLALIEPDELKAVLIKVNGWSDSKEMQLSEAGMALLNEFEGFRSKPYRDSVGKPTIGWGTTYYPDGTPVRMSDKPVTRKEAARIKQAVLNQDFSPAVNMMFADEIERGEITQNMFDALISLVYNIGVMGLKASSIYRNIKAGRYSAAADSFLLYNKGRINGRLEVIDGLVTRRHKERALFLA